MGILKNLKIDGDKSLLVVSKTDKNVNLSSRNLKRSKVMIGEDLNTYDVMNSTKIILVEDCIESIQNVFASNKTEK